MISRCRRRRRKEEVERKMGEKINYEKQKKFPLGRRNPENQASKTKYSIKARRPVDKKRIKMMEKKKKKVGKRRKGKGELKGQLMSG